MLHKPVQFCKQAQLFHVAIFLFYYCNTREIELYIFFFISIFLHYMAKGYCTFEIKVYATMSMLLQLYRRLYSLRRPSGKKLFLKDIKANR